MARKSKQSRLRSSMLCRDHSQAPKGTGKLVPTGHARLVKKAPATTPES